MTSLRLALPSKGRLKEQADAYFADAGLPLVQAGGARGYTASFPALPRIEVRLLSASEIAAALLAGDVHVGVTGEDLLREASPELEGLAHLLMPLGFGRARLVVAAPRSWLDVDTLQDVEDVALQFERRTGHPLRVATKYVRLTRAFLTANGISRYRIVESAGATEGAPAAGAAELVVDITTTGATLEGNGLKILQDGLILDSQAQLCASLRAQWAPETCDALREFMDILDARMTARESRILIFDPAFDVRRLGSDLPAKIDYLRAGEGLCSRADCHLLARAIVAKGGGPVRVVDSHLVFRAANPRFDAFKARLDDQS